jgi:Flp pilus assembly secretin CpaC
LPAKATRHLLANNCAVSENAIATFNRADAASILGNSRFAAGFAWKTSPSLTNGGHAMTAPFRAWLFGVAVFLMLTVTSWAEDQAIVVERGTPFPLVLKVPFDTLLIGNPDIIDVHRRSDRSLIVEGLAPGASNIVFIDERSIAVANVRILVCDAGAMRADGQREDGCESR